MRISGLVSHSRDRTNFGATIKDTFGICVILALRLGGDNFSQAFDKVLKDNEMSEELVAAFDEALEVAHAGLATSSSDESVTLRIFGDDYSAEVFHVG